MIPTIVEAIAREYPNAPRHVMRGADDRPTPREIHPAFERPHGRAGFLARLCKLAHPDRSLVHGNAISLSYALPYPLWRARDSAVALCDSILDAATRWMREHRLAGSAVLTLRGA